MAETQTAPTTLARTDAETFAEDGSHIEALAAGADRAAVAAQLDRKFALAEAQLEAASRIYADDMTDFARRYIGGARSPEEYVAAAANRIRERMPQFRNEADAVYQARVNEQIRAETERGVASFNTAIARVESSAPDRDAERRDALLAARLVKAAELRVADAMLEAELEVTPGRVRAAIARLGGPEAASKMARSSMWVDLIHADARGLLGSL